MTSQALAQAVSRGVQALAAGEPEQAARHLVPVAEDPAFASARDFDDIRARVYSLTAQALLEA